VTDMPQRYRASAERFGELVRSVGAGQWTDPTPCSEWDVRALISHVHGETLWVPELFAGRTIAEVGDRLDGDLLGEDPVAIWERSMGPAIDAIAEPGAMPRIVHLSFGDVPGEDYADQLFGDFVIHGWDLAKAIGADDTIDPSWVEMLYASFKPRESELKSYGVYGDTVPTSPDADLQTQLLAVVGRSRNWPGV
jgi:uncharacterized protein (TIGR03086 family)